MQMCYAICLWFVRLFYHKIEKSSLPCVLITYFNSSIYFQFCQWCAFLFRLSRMFAHPLA